MTSPRFSRLISSGRISSLGVLVAEHHHRNQASSVLLMQVFAVTVYDTKSIRCVLFPNGLNRTVVIFLAPGVSSMLMLLRHLDRAPNRTSEVSVYWKRL